MVASFEHCSCKMTVTEKIYVEDAYHEAGYRKLGGVDLMNTVDESPVGFARDGERLRVADLGHGGRNGRGDCHVGIDGGFCHNTRVLKRNVDAALVLMEGAVIIRKS